jgi:hypothetical protein
VWVDVPGQIAVVLDLESAEFEYSEPREPPREQRAKAQRLMQFAVAIKKTEWAILLRVWKRPDEARAH